MTAHYPATWVSYMHYPGLSANYTDFPAYGAIQPFSAAIGYRLGHNTTLEVGFAGRFPAAQYFSDSTGAYTTEYSRYAYAVPILARVAFVRATLTNPWCVEIEEGLVVLHGHQQALTYQQQRGGRQSSNSISRSDNDVQLALGIGAAYRLNQHWRLTGDLQGQYSLLSDLLGKLFGSSQNAFGGGAAVGIRYAL